ncbi:MAG: uracil-DNA glycosylase [Planctomycetota bacterium]
MEIDRVLRSLRYHVEESIAAGVDRIPEVFEPAGVATPPAAEGTLQPEPASPASAGARTLGSQVTVATGSTPPSTTARDTTRTPGVAAGRQASLFEESGITCEESPAEVLAALAGQAATCTRCKLHHKRTRVVFGEGRADAAILFVGEGPGADEDLQGRPFVGRAGQLLNRIIEAMGLKREEVYIGNIVKCRPPGNRTPERDEVASCLPYLLRQIATIKPRIIVALGAPAMHALLEISTPISQARGKVFRLGEIRVVPTFHPAYLLRNPREKAKVWEDMQLVLKLLAE